MCRGCAEDPRSSGSALRCLRRLDPLVPVDRYSGIRELPTLERRALITAPALVIGHEHDRLHPFHDAENLTRQMPDAQLLRARSLLEMRLDPARLVRRISAFVASTADPARAENG